MTKMYVKDENGIYKLLDKEKPKLEVREKENGKETPLTAAMSIETRLSRLESAVFQGQKQ